TLVVRRARRSTFARTARERKAIVRVEIARTESVALAAARGDAVLAVVRAARRALQLRRARVAAETVAHTRAFRRIAGGRALGEWAKRRRQPVGDRPARPLVAEDVARFARPGALAIATEAVDAEPARTLPGAAGGDAIS